jgi:hypothetical protein
LNKELLEKAEKLALKKLLFSKYNQKEIANESLNTLKKSSYPWKSEYFNKLSVIS